MPASRYVGAEYGTFPFPAIAMGKTGEPEVVSAAGAISVLTEPTQISLTQAGDQALTLADGDESQRKLIYMTLQSGAGNGVVTPASLTGGTTITFSGVGQYSELRFINTSWVQVAGTATVA